MLFVGVALLSCMFYPSLFLSFLKTVSVPVDGLVLMTVLTPCGMLQTGSRDAGVRGRLGRQDHEFRHEGHV